MICTHTNKHFVYAIALTGIAGRDDNGSTEHGMVHSMRRTYSTYNVYNAIFVNDGPRKETENNFSVPTIGWLCSAHHHSAIKETLLIYWRELCPLGRKMKIMTVRWSLLFIMFLSTCKVLQVIIHTHTQNKFFAFVAHTLHTLHTRIYALFFFLTFCTFIFAGCLIK